MTELINAQNKILGYLTRLNDMVIMSNTNGQLTLTKAAENFVSEVFSLLYGIKIVNTNLKIANYPSIDLHSPADRLAIQVSSSEGVDKVVNTLETFLRNGFDRDYDRLVIVILANKKYDIRKLGINVAEINGSFSKTFNFDPTTDLIDLKHLYGQICNEMDIRQTIQIADVMMRYFDEYVGQKDLSSYYQSLRDQFFQTVMDDDRGMTLNSIYVEPSFSIPAQSANRQSALLTENAEHRFSPRSAPSIHQLLNRRFSESPEYDQMFNHPDARVTIVMGYPGQGKTSMCNKLLFDLLTSPFEKNIFYLKLRNITDTRSLIDNPFNVIYAELEMELDEKLTKDMLKNSLVILDGLDELYMKDDLSAEHIETFVKGLITETSKYTDWEVLVTTRHGYINFQRLYRENFIALALDPLNISKQLEWTDRYRKFHPESWLDSSFLTDINNHHSQSSRRHFLSELVNQPLLLYIIASLERPVDFSANRTKIYNLLFDQIIERRYSKDGQIENLKQLTQRDLRFMLQEIAFLIFRSGKGYVTNEEVLRAEPLEEILQKIGDSHLSNSLKGILISFYFKEVKGPSADQAAGIEFFHKSLQEYLTAERITEHIFYTVLNKDQAKQYILKKGTLMLAYLNDLLGEQEITSEIWDFINDLIQKKDIYSRMELAARLGLHIDYFYEKDFIAQVRLEDANTQSKMTLTLNFYWRILTCCNPTVDYMKNRSWVGKHFAINQAMGSVDLSFFGPKCLSYQTLEDVRFSNLQLHSEVLKQAKFIGCYGSSIKLMDCTVKDVLFEDCEFNVFAISECPGNITFEECGFLYCTVYALTESVFTFSKCNFNDHFDIFSEARHSIRFIGCTFHEIAIAEMKGRWQDFYFENCVVERYENNLNEDRYDSIKTAIADTKGGIAFVDDKDQLRLFENE